jgi:thiamine kinase-like enzyme
MNDPLFDLGVLAHAHHLNYEQLQQAYSIIIGGALDEEHRYHIECYRQAYVLRELAWLLLRQVMGGAHELDGVQWYHALLNDPVFNPYFKTE